MRRVLITAVTSLLVLGLPALALAAPHKVDVCHINGKGRLRLINVAGAAVQSHLDHGDLVPGDAVPGIDGYRLDAACSPEPIEEPEDTPDTPDTPDTEVMFAVAYTDIEPDDGFFNPLVDVLIAKFVDGNGNGVPDGGDRVVTNVYPTALEAPFNHMAFSITEHTIYRAAYDPGTNEWRLFMDAGNSDLFVFQHDEGQEWYRETRGGAAADWTTLLDWMNGPIDQIHMSSASRSQPADFDVWANLGEDLQFLDVDILVVP
jgi:hypothetical protein